MMVREILCVIRGALTKLTRIAAGSKGALGCGAVGRTLAGRAAWGPRGGAKIWRVAGMAECPEVGLGSFGYLGVSGTAGVVGRLIDSAARVDIEL